MSSNLDQAVTSVLEHGDPLTVVKVLVAYLKVIGYAVPESNDITVPHEAIIAFEHALDKEPALSSPPFPPMVATESDTKLLQPPSSSTTISRRMYTKEITELRKEYWRKRLGYTAAVRCTCPTCGSTTSVYGREPSEEEFEAEPEAAPEKPKCKGKGKRVAKRRRAPKAKIPVFDPYGPSSSSFTL